MSIINQQATCQRIEILRKEKGITPAEISRKLNLSLQSVNQWQLGKNLPSLENMILLAKLFDVTILDILVINDIDIW